MNEHQKIGTAPLDPIDEHQDRDAWNMTRRKRFETLERRRKYLNNILESGDPALRNNKRRSFWLAEWEALDWALPILYARLFPENGPEWSPSLTSDVK